MREALPAFVLKSTSFLFVTLLLGQVYLAALLVLYPWRLRLGPELVRIYSRICLKIFRVKIGRVEHMRLFRAIRGRVLIAANHVSFLDIFVISAVFGAAFVSKAEVRRYPIIGWIAGLMGCIFFDRGSSLERLRVVKAVAGSAGARVIAVFPQGTTGSSSRSLPFHRGIFKTVEMDPSLTMLPVTVRYRQEDSIAWDRPQAMRDNLMRVCGEERIDVDVIVHEPVASRDYRGKTTEEVCRMVEAAVTGPLQGSL